MKDFFQLRQEANAIHYDFLVSDLKTAFTFLELASTTHNGETRARNLQHARVALETVARLRSRVAMTDEQAMEMQEKLDLLQSRIESMARSDPGTE